MRKAVRQFVFYAGLLTLWQLIAWVKIWPEAVFPGPASVFSALRDGFTHHAFAMGIWVSLRRVAIGFTISVTGGLVLGYLIAYNQYFAEASGLLESLQSLPSLCWLPVAILWFGATEKAILFMVVAGSLVSVTISVEAALRGVPKIYAMAGRNLGAHGWKLAIHVLLPACLPHLVDGLKQAWAFAWRALISGEMIFLTLGLGQLLVRGRDMNSMSQMFAVMLIIVVLGRLVDVAFFGPAERALHRRWGLAA